MYKRVINEKINIKDFFNVYPPLVKVYSEESNKFAKLFEEPKKHTFKNRNSKKNKSNQSTITFNSLKEVNDSNKITSEKNEYSHKDSNSIDTKVKNDTKDIDQLTSESFSKKYFLINKGLELQKTKMKRTHSIKKSLQNFLYKTNVIEKLNENLFSIEKQINTGLNFTKNEKKLENKIKNKINVIVEKLSAQLTIEKIPENIFVIKMNDIGDKCYFLLSGKLSIMKPMEYKNVSLNALDYIHYLINLMRYNEVDLINKVIEVNHIYINIETISNLKLITKGYFLRKADNYLETFKTLTKEDFDSLLYEFNLKLEDFDLNYEQTMKDVEDINNNIYQENNESLDSDNENETEPKSKYALFKAYMNKFHLSIEDKVKLINYNYLFHPHEAKKLYNFTLYKYENFLNLYPGTFFGDMALENTVKKRNASIRTDEECLILSLSNDDYISLLYEDNKKLKSMNLMFMIEKFFFNKISPNTFEKKYYAKFKFFEKNKGNVIYQQDNEFSSIFFLKKGEYKLEIKTSVIDLHNLIKFFIDLLEEKNYLNYSKNFIENLKETYLKDSELLNLNTKNYLYKEKFNEKHKLEMSTINSIEILGDLELFLTSAYINTCTVISQRAEYIEIKKRDLNDIFIEEKEILPDYYSFVMNKLISQIKRLYYLKGNLISQISSKINNHFYQSLISPNFYEQIKNNNTNNYYRDKRNLKKIMPKAFKFSHLSPPVIYDSKWKPKKFEQEKNEMYNYQMRVLEKKEKENLAFSFNANNPNIIKNNKSSELIKKNKRNNNKYETDRKKAYRNQQLNRILEEISTSKSLNNSIPYFNSDHKNKNTNKYKNRRNNKSSDLNHLPFHLDTNSIVAGKYILSLRKLTKEMSNMENHDPLNLNIVKKISMDKSTTANLQSINQSNHLSSSSSNSYLPPIKLYKQKHILHHYKKSENLSGVFNEHKRINREIENNILLNSDIKMKEKIEISQAIKNYYNKQKKSGYSSLVNKNNNKFYKVGKNNFFN